MNTKNIKRPKNTKDIMIPKEFFQPGEIYKLEWSGEDTFKVPYHHSVIVKINIDQPKEVQSYVNCEILMSDSDSWEVGTSDYINLNVFSPDEVTKL